jgi:hypothetical protein
VQRLLKDTVIQGIPCHNLDRVLLEFTQASGVRRQESEAYVVTFEESSGKPSPDVTPRPCYQNVRMSSYFGTPTFDPGLAASISVETA